MPKTRPIHLNFTSGELSPLLDGRVDLAAYHNAAKTLENFRSLPFGPAERRPGTRHSNEVKTSADIARILPFQFSTTQAYIIEAGNLYFRFYKDGLRIGTVEVVTPYTLAQLFAIGFAQSADVLYLVHGSHAPRKLERTSDTAWTLSTINFSPPPTFEAPTDLATTLTPGATSGSGVTFTAGAAVFLDGDIDREISFGTARGIIRTLVGAPRPATQVTVDIIDNFPDTNPIASGSWFLGLSPAATLTPGKIGPLNAITTLTLGTTGWRAADVGKYVLVNGGVVKVLTFTSDTVVSGEILSALDNTTAATAGTWSLEEEDWTAARGFPDAVSFHEGRLWFGRLQTIWGSVPGLFEVMALGPNDDDAIKFVYASNQVNTIRWLQSSRTMLIGTAGGELRMFTQNDAPVTPSNGAIRPATKFGSAAHTPLNVGPAVLFIQDSKKHLREFLFNFQDDDYIAPDLLLLAEHLTSVDAAGTSLTLVEMAFQRSPRPYVWVVRSDGTLLGLSYDRSQEVVGWHRHTTNGFFESVAVIPHPNGDRDQVWFIVRRTINGVTKRFLEYFDEVSGFYQAINVDSGVVYNGVATTTVTGLDHLDGETVKITGDGAVYNDAVVTAGSVTLVGGDAASEIEVGLPYTSTLKTMRPELAADAGTIQGKQKGWNEVFIRLHKTLGGKINGQQLPFRKAADLFGNPPSLFTGDKKVQTLGMDSDGHVEYIQDQALPATVVAVYGNMNVGD